MRDARCHVGTVGLIGAALALVAGSAGDVRAQGLGAVADAHVAVTPVISLQDATMPAVESRRATVLVITADLVVSANAAYDVLVLPTSGMELLQQKRIRMSVLTASGAYAPVDGSAAVVLASQLRGAGRRTHVVFRFESATPITDADVAVGVEYHVVAQMADGEARLSVLARQQIALVARVSHTRLGSSDSSPSASH